MKADARGFALVLTLTLLALLVLTVYALGALTRAGTAAAATGAYQVQARQHALLGLGVALGELQRYAGDDAARTGMAGITGVPAGASHPTRHWCGVWDDVGTFRRWLASGAESETIPVFAGTEAVTMVGEGALGADGADKEHVQALPVAVEVLDSHGVTRRQGCYAWWVGDEGVKLSAVLPEVGTPAPGGRHAIDELIAALSPEAANLVRVESYSQLALVPSPVLTPGQLQANFHVLTRTHAGPVLSGLLNVNTTAARFWRGVAATYNRLKSVDDPPLATIAFGNDLRDANTAWWVEVEDFLASEVLAEALDQNGGVAPETFAAVMQPWLATRSNTFRIRAYGDAANPSEPARIEAVAWCEAIVERTDGILPGFGGRFMVRAFRWLGPDDI
jgi:hypothetical protein